MYDDSCNLFSNTKVENYYKTLIDKLKTSAKSSFNLIHLLQANILSLLQENLNINSSILIDKKSYPECEPKPTAFFLTEELHCSDETAEYTDTYVFENLIPSTTYQFRIEVANAFGKSATILTDRIEVPFPLNDIVERDETRNNKPYYSLECSTPLLETRKLEFKWYKNEQLILTNDTDYEQVLHQPMNEYAGAIFSTELIFKDSAKKNHAFYTCSLSYVDDTTTLTKNDSFIYRSKTGPFYISYQDSVVNKSYGESLSDSCSADGWPLPLVQWYYNGNPVSNKSDEAGDDTKAQAISHHRHLTASSHLIIKLVDKSNTGTYSCVVNGKIAVKNVTLKLNSNADDSSSNKNIIGK